MIQGLKSIFQKRSNDFTRALATQPVPRDQRNLTSGNLCRRCTDLKLVDLLFQDGITTWEFLTSGSFEDRLASAINLGPIEDIKYQYGCPLCPLLEAIVPKSNHHGDESHLYLIPGLALERMERSITFCPGSMFIPYKKPSLQYCQIVYPATVYYDGGWSCGKATRCFTSSHEANNALAVAHESSTIQPAMGGRKTLGDRIDYDLLRYWIERCCKNHPISCTPTYTVDLERIRLIDVTASSVVCYPCDKKVEYLCLSYVWGHVLQESFGLGLLPSNLPSTITDAISVVRCLGKRYLWVDSICIEQSNQTHKADQISLMGSIYKGAWATIVALSGRTSDSGLPRVRNRLPRAQQRSSIVHNATVVELLPTLQQQIIDSLWKKRAWTLQEEEFSNRCLYFTQQQIYFGCNSIQCCESVKKSHAPYHSWRSQSKLSTRVGPQDLQHEVAPGIFDLNTIVLDHNKGFKRGLKIYEYLVQEYTGRRLSYESDALNASQGLLDDLQNEFLIQGFCQGLPIEFFTLALMWNHSGKSRRRYEFPSWSWAGWEGKVSRALDTGRLYNRSTPTEDPLIRICTSEQGHLVEIFRDTFRGLSDIIREALGSKPQLCDLNANCTPHQQARLTNIHHPLYIEGLAIPASFVLQPKQENSVYRTSFKDLSHRYNVDTRGINFMLICYDENAIDLLSRLPSTSKLFLVLDCRCDIYSPGSLSILSFSLLFLDCSGPVAYRVSTAALTVEMKEETEAEAVIHALSLSWVNIVLG